MINSPDNLSNNVNNIEEQYSNQNSISEEFDKNDIITKSIESINSSIDVRISALKNMEKVTDMLANETKFGENILKSGNLQLASLTNQKSKQTDYFPTPKSINTEEYVSDFE